MPTPPLDIAAAHRWFGIECNNAAWDLLELPSRSADESDHMLHLAHAALHHWSHIGTPINRLRGLCLLATTCTAAGRSEEATHWASACLALSDKLGMPDSPADQHKNDAQTAFDRACAHACAASAYQLTNRTEATAEQEALTRAALINCDAEECKVIESLYSIGR